MTLRRRPALYRSALLATPLLVGLALLAPPLRADAQDADPKAEAEQARRLVKELRSDLAALRKAKNKEIEQLRIEANAADEQQLRMARRFDKELRRLQIEKQELLKQLGGKGKVPAQTYRFETKAKGTLSQALELYTKLTGVQTKLVGLSGKEACCLRVTGLNAKALAKAIALNVRDKKGWRAVSTSKTDGVLEFRGG